MRHGLRAATGVSAGSGMYVCTAASHAAACQRTWASAKMTSTLLASCGQLVTQQQLLRQQKPTPACGWGGL